MYAGVWILKKVLNDFRTHQKGPRQIEMIQYYHRVILFILSKDFINIDSTNSSRAKSHI